MSTGKVNFDQPVEAAGHQRPLCFQSRLTDRLSDPRVRSIHGLVCCSGVGRASHCWAEVAVFGRSAAAGTT
jgi:hypothetical protein